MLAPKSTRRHFLYLTTRNPLSIPFRTHSNALVGINIPYKIKAEINLKKFVTTIENLNGYKKSLW
ncbi:MAG: hypothetical protein NVS2B12_41540 [Ktedonobacteraceae bacterium]